MIQRRRVVSVQQCHQRGGTAWRRVFGPSTVGCVLECRYQSQLSSRSQGHTLKAQGCEASRSLWMHDVGRHHHLGMCVRHTASKSRRQWESAVVARCQLSGTIRALLASYTAHTMRMPYGRRAFWQYEPQHPSLATVRHCIAVVLHANACAVWP